MNRKVESKLTRSIWVGAAAVHDLHVIQGPNVTRDARERIAFFAFHAFVVEDSRFQQNRVRAKLYNCGACVCKSNVEIRIAGSFCHPQLNYLVMLPQTQSFFRKLPPVTSPEIAIYYSKSQKWQLIMAENYQ